MDLQAIASRIKAAQDHTQQIAPLTSQHRDFDIGAAYAVAHRLHRARLAEGAVAVGRKIGFTNAALWPVFGVREPIWGYVYDTTVVHLPAGPSTCRIARFAEPKIEPEIVVHFASPPPVTADLGEILACVDWVAHGIEIVQSHFPGWKFEAPDTVADAALHATLLVGAPRAVDRLGGDPIAALERFSITLSCDGELRDSGTGRNVLGGPLASIAHLAGVLAKQQAVPLAAHELVTTGTLTQALTIRAGETWTTELQGIALPGLSVRFVD